MLILQRCSSQVRKTSSNLAKNAWQYPTDCFGTCPLSCQSSVSWIVSKSSARLWRVTHDRWSSKRFWCAPVASIAASKFGFEYYLRVFILNISTGGDSWNGRIKTCGAGKCFVSIWSFDMRFGLSIKLNTRMKIGRFSCVLQCLVRNARCDSRTRDLPGMYSEGALRAACEYKGVSAID